ncbi:Ser/Thr phosphatase family protein, partial [Trichinella nativa]
MLKKIIRSVQEKQARWKELQEKLLRNRGSTTPLTEQELMEILNAAIPLLLAEQSLIEFNAPVVICGDIHGQFEDLLRLYDSVGWPPEKRYLFLGDYVDRGPQSVEVMSLQILLKLQYPNDYFLLRGNHEHAVINQSYGFYNECTSRYSVNLWKRFQVFDQGYQFFAERRCVTVFSAPNYCNIFNNAAAALIIDKNLNCKIV